jgi:hypothetical protein
MVVALLNSLRRWPYTHRAIFCSHSCVTAQNHDLRQRQRNEQQNRRFDNCDSVQSGGLFRHYHWLRCARSSWFLQRGAQGERLQSLLKKHGANPQLHTDQAMKALISETEKNVLNLEGR